VYATGEAKSLVLSTLAAGADSIVADGLASRDEVAVAIDHVAAFTHDPTTLLAEPRVFQVRAYRSE
jgi:hypothetical protein